MEIFKEKMEIALKKANLIIDEYKIDKLYIFYQKLVEVNQYMNLTAITEMEEVIYKHFLDSILILKYFPEIKNEKIRIIDIGTGAGFPGLPLAIVCDDIEIYLLDSLNKRINFINTIIKLLSLKNIKAVHGRAEDFAKKSDFREQFDFSLSRAVANLSTLSEYCIPFVKKNGRFIAYKSGEIDKELEDSKKAIGILGGKIDKKIEFSLPEFEAGRSFIVINKIKNTEKKYPRKAGLPSKEPLR